MSTPINQHYIPQFLLRNFHISEKTGKEKSIFVFDKDTGKVFKSPIKQAATQRYFYESKIIGKNYSIEPELEKFESAASPIIKKIIKNKGLKQITRKEKVILTRFICVQFLRVPATRNKFLDFTEQLHSRFDFFTKSGINKPDSELEKINHCNFILGTINRFFPLIYNKDWILFESSDSKFIIGDNPVVLNNSIYKGRGTLGLSSLGIEIYVPLSPQYSLLLVCNSVKKIFLKNTDFDIKHTRLEKDVTKLKEMANVLKNSLTIKASLDDVEFANSLQVIFSERFLYSHRVEFYLPDKIL